MQEGKAGALLDEACEQISSRYYGEQMARKGELFRVGMMFSEAKRQLAGWRLV